MKEVICREKINFKFVFTLVIVRLSLNALGASNVVKQILAGNKFSLVLTKDGVLYGCGSNSRSVLGTDVGTKGSYWPVDEYGNLKDLMTFEIDFTATWTGGSYYSIDVERKVIRKKILIAKHGAAYRRRSYYF